MTWHEITTAQGKFHAAFTEKGLARLEFPSSKKYVSSGKPDQPQSRWLPVTCKAVESILAGKQPSKFPPLDLGDATPFQRSVWRQLQNISVGETKS